MKTKILQATGLSIALMACGGTEGDNNTGEQGIKACNVSADCGAEAVCLSANGKAACAPICTASANECSGSASCGGVGVLTVEVCQEPKKQEETPKPEEDPYIPCSTDVDCQVFAATAICAQFQGRKDCTIPCSAEPQCDPPTLGGVKMDFMTCISDEGNTARMACLPDAACFNNPMSCITGF